MRPTKYLAKWSARDRSLAEALLTYEGALNGLGIPYWRSRDPERRWVVDEALDYPARALEEAQAEYARGETPTHGLRLHVVERPASSPASSEV